MDISGKRFILTGGAGFTGSSGKDLLLEEGASEVVVFDTMHCGNHENLQYEDVLAGHPWWMQSVLIPLYSGLSNTQQDVVITALWGLVGA